MDINVNGVNKSQKNDNNKVSRYLNDENSSKQSGSIFDKCQLLLVNSKNKIKN